MKKEEMGLKTSYLVGIIVLLSVLLLLLCGVLFLQNMKLKALNVDYEEKHSSSDIEMNFQKYEYEQLVFKEFSEQTGDEVMSLLQLEEYLRAHEFQDFVRSKYFVQALKEETCYEEGKLVGNNDCKLLVIRFDGEKGAVVQIFQVEEE